MSKQILLFIEKLFEVCLNVILSAVLPDLGFSNNFHSSTWKVKKKSNNNKECFIIRNWTHIKILLLGVPFVIALLQRRSSALGLYPWSWTTALLAGTEQHGENRHICEMKNEIWFAPNMDEGELGISMAGFKTALPFCFLVLICLFGKWGYLSGEGRMNILTVLMDLKSWDLNKCSVSVFSVKFCVFKL